MLSTQFSFFAQPFHRFGKYLTKCQRLGITANGAIVIGVAPDILLNGQSARLAPGARIRDQNNMIVVPSALTGGRYLVNYNIDTSGLVKEVWVLRPEEAAMQPWPTTPEQAEAWNFDPIGQVWTKP